MNAQFFKQPMHVRVHSGRARAVTRYGKQQQFAALDLEQFESVTGLGLKARHNGQSVVLGRREWLLHEGSGAPPERAAPATGPIPAREWLAQVPPIEAGFSEVWLVKGDLVGRVLLRDDIRPQSRPVVEQLRQE